MTSFGMNRPFFRSIIVAVSYCLLLVLMVAVQPLGAQPAESSETSEYVIGVEDRLTVSVWQQPDLSLSVVVRPDGMITVPLVGDVKAAGRTPGELSGQLTEALSRYVKEPIVTVSVEEINHFKIYVLGEVNTQGVLQLSRPTRLLQAIALSGGLTPYANKSHIVLIRHENGKEIRRRIDYRKVLNGERASDNVYLRPGDTIIVK